MYFQMKKNKLLVVDNLCFIYEFTFLIASFCLKNEQLIKEKVFFSHEKNSAVFIKFEKLSTKTNNMVYPYNNQKLLTVLKNIPFSLFCCSLFNLIILCEWIRASIRQVVVLYANLI